MVTDSVGRRYESRTKGRDAFSVRFIAASALALSQMIAARTIARWVVLRARVVVVAIASRKLHFTAPVLQFSSFCKYCSERKNGLDSGKVRTQRTFHHAVSNLGISSPYLPEPPNPELIVAGHSFSAIA